MAHVTSSEDALYMNVLRGHGVYTSLRTRRTTFSNHVLL